MRFRIFKWEVTIKRVYQNVEDYPWLVHPSEWDRQTRRRMAREIIHRCREDGGSGRNKIHRVKIVWKLFRTYRETRLREAKNWVEQCFDDYGRGRPL